MTDVTVKELAPADRSAGKRATGKVVFYATVIFMCVMLVLPVIAFFVNAFAFRWFYPQLIPDEWSLQAWQRLGLLPPPGQFSIENLFAQWASVPDVVRALGLSLWIGFLVTGVSIVIGMPAARALGMYSFRGKRLVEFIIITPTIVPPIAFSLGLNINFIRWDLALEAAGINLGLSGSVLGVSIVHLVPVMPYVVLTLSGVFANYNADFEAQARTLGAGPFRTFWHVTFPAILPGLFVACLFAFLVSWSQYLLTFLIGQGRVITLPILLFSAAGSGNNAVIAALSLIFIAPAVLILLVSSRYLSGESGAVGGFGRV
ncbi:MAG: ABC transporter permease subunit [Pseudomonadota bacterium]